MSSTNIALRWQPVSQPSDEAFPLLGADELRVILADSGESALVDVREEGTFSNEGHLLLAVSLPLSRLELRAASLIPRLMTRVIVHDGGGGTLAAQAARRLRDLGYADVAIFSGGVAAWRAAGGEVFTGSNVVGKAFGEFVEHVYDTPRLSAAELKHRLDAGEDIVVLDSRPLPEFETMSIPGGIDCPGAELVYRVHDLAPSPETLVVVNCAGRTRSIIGAQALVNAGIPNPVASLENGTMAWLLNGYDLDHGQRRHAAAPTEAGLSKAKAAAAHLSARFEVETIDLDTFARYRADAGRSLYALDVRTAEEFEAGHLQGARWAPGGQVVQGIDQWVATRNARIILIDNPDGVRATITASWLKQIGWGDVFVLPLDPRAVAVETGPEFPVVLGTPPAHARLTPTDLTALLDLGSATVLDLATSTEYRAGHIPGAHFAIRARLPDEAGAIPGTGIIALTSPDGVLAEFASAELTAVVHRPVRVLIGGTAAWVAEGRAVATGDEKLISKPDDLRQSPYHAADPHAAFREYLDWELGLVAQLERDRTIAFRRFA